MVKLFLMEMPRQFIEERRGFLKQTLLSQLDILTEKDGFRLHTSCYTKKLTQNES